KEAELAERGLTVREAQVKDLVAAIQAEGFTEEEFKKAKERHDRAQLALHEAQLKVVEARGDLVRGEEDLRDAERREAERTAGGAAAVAARARRDLRLPRRGSSPARAGAAAPSRGPLPPGGAHHAHRAGARGPRPRDPRGVRRGAGDERGPRRHRDLERRFGSRRDRCGRGCLSAGSTARWPRRRRTSRR